MPFVKCLSVGNGDMYYISHSSDNFSVIDCHMGDDVKEEIMDEVCAEAAKKGVVRFISTHPDEDHVAGLAYLDQRLNVLNFYCVRNEATKPDESDSFKHYCALRDGSKAYYIYKGCQRKWMNLDDQERGCAGIHVLWPDTSNSHFLEALEEAKQGVKFNNISAGIQYIAANNVKMLWLGDLETEFMELIESDITLPKTHIVFAPHHGRVSGKIPDLWLDKLKPNVIVIGEAPSRHLHYYSGYRTITQNRADNIIFDLTTRTKFTCTSRTRNTLRKKAS
jgi:beta-lactamase superfamily II metal-dependent hydrolase